VKVTFCLNQEILFAKKGKQILGVHNARTDRRAHLEQVGGFTF